MFWFYAQSKWLFFLFFFSQGSTCMYTSSIRKLPACCNVSLPQNPADLRPCQYHLYSSFIEVTPFKFSQTPMTSWFLFFNGIFTARLPFPFFCVVALAPSVNDGLGQSHFHKWFTVDDYPCPFTACRFIQTHFCSKGNPLQAWHSSLLCSHCLPPVTHGDRVIGEV